MSIDFSKLRSVTARQFASALQSDASNCKGKKVATVITSIPMDAGLVSLSTTLPIHFLPALSEASLNYKPAGPKKTSNV